jgi:prepilin-type processing-associated H-X9-DG protein
VFRCPTAPTENRITIFLSHTYGLPDRDFNAAVGTLVGYTPPSSGRSDAGGVSSVTGLPGANVLGVTNYLASAGDFRSPVRFEATDPPTGIDPRGVFYYKSTTTLAKIPDGTTNTIMFVEAAGGKVTVSGLGTGWANDTWNFGIWYSAFWICPRRDNNNCDFSAGGRGVSWGLASSLHDGPICNVAMADGSVRSIAAGRISFATLSYLTGTQDGVVRSADD